MYTDAPAYIPLLNLGLLYVLALLIQKLGDVGVKGALQALATVGVTIPLAIAKMKTHQASVHRGVGCGLAKYVATGRDLATRRVTFVETFKRYTASHMGPAIVLGVVSYISSN